MAAKSARIAQIIRPILVKERTKYRKKIQLAADKENPHRECFTG